MTKLAPKKKPITANNLISPAPNALNENKGNKRIIGRIAPPKELIRLDNLILESRKKKPKDKPTRIKLFLILKDLRSIATAMLKRVRRHSVLKVILPPRFSL